MPRPRGFDELEAVRAAAAVFTRLGYEGTSVDDLVRELGVHRGSLYRVFGSKTALLHRALRLALDEQVLPWAASVGALPHGAAPPGAGLFLVAAVERAAVDPTVAAAVRQVHDELVRSAPAGTSRQRAEQRAAETVGRLVLDRAGIDPGREADSTTMRS